MCKDESSNNVPCRGHHLGKGTTVIMKPR